MALRKNTYWNLIGAGFPLVAALVFIPFTLKSLGNELFGLLTLIWAMIGYFSFFDMGIGRALTYKLSKYNLEKDILEISLTLKAGIILICLAGAVGVMSIFFFAPMFVIKFLKIGVELQRDVLLSFQIATLGIFPTILTGVLRGALEGLGNFASSNINKIVLGCSLFLLPFLVVFYHGNDLPLITTYLVAARLIASILALIPLRKYLTDFNQIPKRIHFIELMNYGFWITLTAIISPLMVYGDRFFVGGIIGAEQLPLYAIPQEGLQRLLIIPTALGGALLPHFSMLKGYDLIFSYKKSFSKIFNLMLILSLTVICLSYPFFTFWISSTFAKDSFFIVLVLTVGIFFNSLALIPYTLIHALGNSKVTALCHILELVFYVSILFLLTQRFGLIGAAFAWTLRVILDFILLNFIANKFLIISSRFIKDEQKFRIQN